MNKPASITEPHCIDLRRYCWQFEPIRTWMREPFTLKGRIIATNGHILASVPGDNGNPLTNNKAAESVWGIINECLIAAYQPMQPIELPDGDTCFDCKGTGKAKFVTCIECEGSGEVTIKKSKHYYEATCKECAGDGWIVATLKTDHPCQTCFGSGRINPYNEPFTAEQIGFPCSPNYLRLIIDLPDVHIATGINAKGHGKLYFKSGDVLGCLMGMRPD